MPHSGCSALHRVIPNFKKNLPITCLLLTITFRLKGKEKLVKHQKVTKHSVYDETGFLDQYLAFAFCESQ